MRKFIGFLIKSDQQQRTNIYCTAFIAVVIVNFITIYYLIKQKLTGEVTFDGTWTLPILDGIVALLLLFMYVIPEALFKVRNAFILGFLFSLGSCIYLAGTDGLIIGLRLVLDIISTTLEMGFLLVPIGIILRGPWEDMQKKVGGDYRELNITLNNVLSNRNILTFSSLAVIYAFSVGGSKINSITNLNVLFLSLQVGVTVLVLGFVLRKILRTIASFIKVEIKE